MEPACRINDHRIKAVFHGIGLCFNTYLKRVCHAFRGERAYPELASYLYQLVDCSRPVDVRRNEKRLPALLL